MPRTSSTILYLDYDGVLHADDVYIDARHRPFMRGEGALFEYAHCLAQILAPYPEVALVLSTSWVRVKGFTYAVKRLPDSLRSRVIGATWHSGWGKDPERRAWWIESSTRYMQIAGDVGRRKPSYWLALDDDAEGWPDTARGHLINCNPWLGLSEPQVLAQLDTRLAQGRR